MEKETKETAIAELNTGGALVNQNTGLNELLFDDARFGRLHQLASIMANGRTTVPKHLQGNEADCMAVCLQSAQWGLNPIVVAQKTHLVNGTLGYEAQLVNAVILSSGILEGRPEYEYLGDWSRIRGRQNWSPEEEQGLGVKVIATMKTGDRREWSTYMAECKVRNSPNWKSKPMLQTSYQAIKEWCRVHAPDVILGVYTADELDTRHRGTVTVSEVREGGTRTDRLSSILGVESDDDIKVEATESETTDPQEIKRVSKQMLDDALESAGVSADMLFDYAIEKGAIKPEQDIYNLPANWKRSIVADPSALNEKVNDWLESEAEKPEPEDLDKLRRNFHAVGVEVYGDDWDNVRADVCDWYNVKSSNDLTAEQLADAIGRIQAEQ